MFLAALLMSGCAGSGSRAAGEAGYVIPPGVDVTRLLSPPPTQGAALERDLAGVRAAQEARTPGQIAHAEESSTVDVFQFAAVLGAGFAPERVPQTARFLGRVYRSSLPYLQVTKECWHRPRPFVADPALEPLARSLESTRSRPASPGQTSPGRAPGADSPCSIPPENPAYAYSYPSGHATVGAMMAIVLAQMVPERRAALFELGWFHGEARVISGVHFPSDIEAGRILGAMLVGMMQQDAKFRADMHAARRELRAALGYD